MQGSKDEAIHRSPGELLLNIVDNHLTKENVVQGVWTFGQLLVIMMTKLPKVSGQTDLTLLSQELDSLNQVMNCDIGSQYHDFDALYHDRQPRC